MKVVFNRLINSLKFWELVIGLICLVAKETIPALEGVDTKEVIALFVALIAGQGLADFGKEAKE